VFRRPESSPEGGTGHGPLTVSGVHRRCQRGLTSCLIAAKRKTLGRDGRSPHVDNRDPHSAPMYGKKAPGRNDFCRTPLAFTVRVKGGGKTIFSLATPALVHMTGAGDDVARVLLFRRVSLCVAKSEGRRIRRRDSRDRRRRAATNGVGFRFADGDGSRRGRKRRTGRGAGRWGATPVAFLVSTR